MPELPLVATEILPVFVRNEVRFIVVGAVAAVLEGSPILTKDVDLLIDVEATNLDRALAAALELEAIYRDPAKRTILPSRDKFDSFRLHLFRCAKGDFDLLREIGSGWGYHDLLPRSFEVQLSFGSVRVLGLEAVIESKEIANRDKDHAVLPVLRETLRLARFKNEGP